MLRNDFNDGWRREQLISFANNVAEKREGELFRLPEEREEGRGQAYRAGKDRQTACKAAGQAPHRRTERAG